MPHSKLHSEPHGEPGPRRPTVFALVAPLVALVAVAGLALAFAAPAAAQPARLDHSLRIHGGLFEPDGDSDYWRDAEDLFGDDASSFDDATILFEYELGLSPRFSLLFSFDGYSSTSDRSYVDFVDNRGREIESEAELTVASGTVGGIFHLAPTHWAIQPYVGAGGGLYAYTLREEGDFIDFGFDPPDVFFDEFEAEGVAFGYYWLAGLEVPITPQISLMAEGRWTRAEDELEDDFDGFGDLDLSGRQITGGVVINF